MSKWRLRVKTLKVGSECSLILEVDDKDLEDMSEDEAANYVAENIAQDQLGNLIEWDVERVEE